ncbi:MAG: redoxin domain-containing protein [Planctomycetes bacterium]|nr:redoxin domain-containing protein [Planctomycetota bacterium]
MHADAPRPAARRRLWYALAAVAVLVGGYFGVTAWIRRHVDQWIQAAVGQPLPAFRLADRDGRVWSDADLRGKRAVLHFFRSRCHSCDLEAPAIRDLEARLPPDVVCLHVMTDALLDFPPELTAATIAGKAFARPVLMADAAFVDAFHQVRWSNVTPVTYVVDTASVVRFGLRGRQTADGIAAALERVR